MIGRRTPWFLVLTVALLSAGCGSSIGDACTTAQDCGGRECLSNSTFPGGYCSEDCVLGDSGSCPTGSECIEFGGTAVCLRQCADDTECRSGYTCQTFAGDGTFCLSPNS